ATGIFFEEQTVASLTAAVKEFIKIEDKFDRKVIRRNAERFSRERFKQEIREKVNEAVCSASG
ncbi:MAG TPA: glycosyltransferase family 4 protein, partial [Syntrophothermus lipocalidus]|nr:glycosyltransferase family 4 protein [Syntrophothermus lipocalidus]